MNVQGEHIDLKGQCIHIPNNKANDKDGTAIITPELDAMLRKRFPGGTLPHGPLLTDVPNDERVVSNIFRGTIAKKAAVKGNGLDGYCTLHDLRRNYGSRWASRVPAQLLQRMMRHAHISTTMEHYADAEKAAVGVMWGKEQGRGE